MSERPFVLIFAAHADDCEFFCAGLVARFVAEGHAVVEVIATDNSRGSFDLDSESLVARSREVEARDAAKILGKHELIFLGHPDGYLDEVPKNELRRVYMELIRRYRPRIALTFDPDAPFEEHPDHRHVALAAREALHFSHMPLYHPEQLRAGLAPHLVAERYYFAKSPVRVNCIVDISAHIDRKIEALCAHESQMRLTVEDLRLSLEASGRHPELLPALAQKEYRPLLELMIRTWAQATGRPAGYEYGEAFRFEYPGEIVDRTTPD